MKILAILFFISISLLWYFVAWNVMSHDIYEAALQQTIPDNQLQIVHGLFLAGMFVLGVLFGKLLSYEKKVNPIIKKEEEIPGIIENGTRNDLPYQVEGIIPDEHMKEEIDTILLPKSEYDFSFINTDVPEQAFSQVAHRIQYNGRDNFKIIEGIGPKIEGILHKAHIYSYKELSQESPEHLLSILHTAGMKRALHNPTTWPKQAQMADNKDFEGLLAYQQNLIKGVEQ